MKSIKKVTFNNDFVNPLILKILRDSKGPMAALAITYMVNQHFGREVNSGIIKRHLSSLVDVEKISKNSNNMKNIAYYKLIV
jgi:repressor of nif and glnA expression